MLGTLDDRVVVGFVAHLEVRVGVEVRFVVHPERMR